MAKPFSQLTARNTESQQGVVTEPTTRHWPFDDTGFAPLTSLRREVDEVDAQYSNGVLHLSVPKPKTQNTKPVPVKIKTVA